MSDGAGFLLREARPEDAETLSRIAIASKGWWGYDEAFLASCRAELTVDPDDLRAGRLTCFVAERAGRILGFHALTRQDGVAWELEALFVAPEHIGTGVGRGLMEHAVATARRRGGTRLVIQGDPHAERFYRAAGAVKVGERESESIPGRMLPLFHLELREPD